MQLGGIHHLTAITANVRENYRFYTRVLGMRLVKRSVNQDDVSAYHLFYADGAGSPGTDITFFDWKMPSEVRGTHSIVRTLLRVGGTASLEWWAQRLAREGVATTGVMQRDGRATLDFEDAEGQRLSLVDDGGAGDDPVTWERSPVPPGHQIRGLGPIIMSVPELGPTAAILTDVLNMKAGREYAHPASSLEQVHVFEMGPGGAGAELHVAVQPDLPVARQGAGGVHHVAFRTPTYADYDGWVATLRRIGVPNSGPIDRYYFRSLYFREPNGVLFEIATDEPGFAVDEDASTLGDRIALPPFLEPHRDRIVANLQPIE
ncbi:MAG: ring-cleaving dioxygenase [Gemmatimonadetes bacterium]|nr:ring-cleaving dioxygenase [Gemmatimonadota bacterium]